MVEILKGLRSYRALFAGSAVFYLLSLWFVSQQYHVLLLAKVRGASTAATPKSAKGLEDVRNATLGVCILTPQTTYKLLL